MTREKKRVAPRASDDRTEQYWPLLNTVKDPELGIGIVDLGLIYDVTKKKNGTLHVIMTLTSMGCPAGPEIMGAVERVLKNQGTAKRVEVDLVWEPVWGPDLINPEVRNQLFL